MRLFKMLNNIKMFFVVNLRKAMTDSTSRTAIMCDNLVFFRLLIPAIYQMRRFQRIVYRFVTCPVFGHYSRDFVIIEWYVG